MRKMPAPHFVTAISLMFFACTAFFSTSAAVVFNIDDYSFPVPKKLLKNKNNSECVEIQNGYFNGAMHQILGNEFVISLETDYGYEGSDNLQGPVCILSKGVLRILRNAVYARHGRAFDSKDLQLFFYTMHKKVFKKNSKYNDTMLTKTDKENIAYILKLEKE